MAAAIAILQVAPIRLKNLSELDLDRNLIARGKRLYLVIDRVGDQERRAHRLRIAARNGRDRRLVCSRIPAFLIRKPTDALRPRGCRILRALCPQISATVFKYTGVKFNVHLFRHAGGKLFLDACPGQYEVVRRVLGHRSIETTTSVYTGAEMRTADQHFAAVIAERRMHLEDQIL